MCERARGCPALLFLLRLSPSHTPPSSLRARCLLCNAPAQCTRRRHDSIDTWKTWSSFNWGLFIFHLYTFIFLFSPSFLLCFGLGCTLSGSTRLLRQSCSLFVLPANPIMVHQPSLIPKGELMLLRMLSGAVTSDQVVTLVVDLCVFVVHSLQDGGRGLGGSDSSFTMAGANL